LNPEDCGSKLVISMEGLEVGHSGRGGEIKVVKAIIYKMEPSIGFLSMFKTKKIFLKILKNLSYSS
jgi:hypothetical protein